MVALQVQDLTVLGIVETWQSPPQRVQHTVASILKKSRLLSYLDWETRWRQQVDQQTYVGSTKQQWDITCQYDKQHSQNTSCLIIGKIFVGILAEERFKQGNEVNLGSSSGIRSSMTDSVQAKCVHV